MLSCRSSSPIKPTHSTILTTPHHHTMISACATRAVDDVQAPPVRATYANLYKWPESDAAFVRSVSSNGRIEGERNKHHQRHPSVVDSMSCRQLYLRSYTFTREETVQERTRKCFGRVRKRINREPPHGNRKKKKKKVSCSALFRAFNGLIFCTTKVDVVD